VDDPAASVHVVQPKEHLLRDLADEAARDARGLVPLDEAEQVLAEDLEHHADVLAMGADVRKVVEEGHDV
jgi:hypothetical protein